MTTYFISRHPGAVTWFKSQGREAVIAPHLDLAAVSNGDKVFGTLPVHKVAQLNERGARYFHLQMDVAENQRGIDLTADDMVRLGAKFVEYVARRVSE